MGFNVWRFTRRMERRPSSHESYWYVNFDFWFYDSLAIGLLWSHQRQSVFLSSLQLKTRYLIPTSRGPRVRASYSMWLVTWDILWRRQKTIFLQSRYRCSRCALKTGDAISPFGPSTSVWFAQSYLVPTQSLCYMKGLEQLFPEFENPQTAYGSYYGRSWAGERKFHEKIDYRRRYFRYWLVV